LRRSPSRKSSASQSRFRKFQVVESDDWTFRPTVLVRRGTSQGSGTIVASVDGESLILTASHVLRGTGPITIELHRYNMGLEHLPNSDGLWPRVIDASLAASDTSADIALLKIRTRHALPYVARLGSGDIDPAAHEEMTSLGIDLGTKLSSWSTKLVEVFSFELNERGADRPFLVTAKIPEHGRSGGGLFDQDNRLVGVCVGHAELALGK
jgi:S1-C subfamily serine protease